MKYPIGIQTFDEIVREGYAYVDKTALVYKMVSEGKIYFLSRPRRFGKSLLISTIESYFRGNRDSFRGLAMEKLETEWQEHAIFHIDFSLGSANTNPILEERIETYVRDWEDKWGRGKNCTTIASRIAYVFRKAHEATGRGVVVLIDEYDKPLLDVLGKDIYRDFHGRKMLLEDVNRELLKDLYSVFKATDADLRFVFLTGVTKFSQVSVFSGFNQPQDISLAPAYSTLLGITEEELTEYFSADILSLAQSCGTDEAGIRRQLREQYDGYHFSKNAPGVYNPFSVINCLSQQDIRDFWFASGSPEYLVKLLQGTAVDINRIVGRWYDASDFMDCKAIKAEPLPMVYQSGYLTIKGYNQRRNTFRLDYPNAEVRRGFVRVLSSNYFRDSQERGTWLDNVADALEAGDVEKFRRKLVSLLASVSYRFQRKKDGLECERYFHLTFYLVLQMIGCYTVYAEKETSEGRIDCVIETPDYVYIIEIKLDGSADEALRQITERGYSKPYSSDPRRLIAMGINFSSEKGNIEEIKTEEQKS